MAIPIYHLELTAKGCNARLRLNDMPFISLNPIDEQPVNFAPPCNPYLVGDLNMVDVDILPIVAEDGSVSSFFDAEITGNVRRFEKGDILSPGAGDVVTEFGIPEDLVEQVKEDDLELPQRFTHIFSNDELDFSAELSDPPPFEDQDGLLDYAIHLRDLVKANDLTALMQEMEPKVHVWVAAYEESYDDFHESLRTELAAFLNEGPMTDFERDQVELRPCCSGRLWELRQPGDLALFATELTPDGARTLFDIIVAPRDDQLRIVR